MYLLVLLGVLLSVGLVTSWRINYAPDIFGDEYLYYLASTNVTKFNQLTWDTSPIFVHPPGFFVGSALFLKALGINEATNLFDGIYQARLFNCVVAGFTAALLFHLGRHLGGYLTATLVWLLFMFDPFIIRINRRNMIETLAEGLLVAALCYFYLRRNRFGLGSQLIAGLLFGAALLTKELTIFGYLTLPLYAILRRDGKLFWAVLRVGLVAACCWSLFPLWAWLIGQWDYFLDVKTYTLRRFLGQVQITGWRRSGVSFVDALKVNLQYYATSYLLIVAAAGVLAVLGWEALTNTGRYWLARLRQLKTKRGTPAPGASETALPAKPRTGEAQTFVVAWGAALYGYMGFSVVQGALNDQFFYFLLVPVLLLVAYGGNLALNWALAARHHSRRAGWLGAGVALLLGGTLLFNLYSWQTLFGTSQDNSLAQLAGHIRQQVPPGSKINSLFEKNESTLQGMLPGYEVVSLRDPAQIQLQNVRYNILSTKQLWGKWGNMTDQYFNWVKQNGTTRFSVHGQTFWEVSLHYVNFPDEAANSPSGSGQPAVTPAEGRVMADSTTLPRPTAAPLSGFFLAGQALLVMALLLLGLFFWQDFRQRHA